jgi:very-short-patch-repair endonuclease
VPPTGRLRRPCSPQIACSLLRSISRAPPRSRSSSARSGGSRRVRPAHGMHVASARGDGAGLREPRTFRAGAWSFTRNAALPPSRNVRSTLAAPGTVAARRRSFMRTRFGRPFDFVARHTLGPRARSMRAAPTQSEALLWSALRSSQLGLRFRRQVVLGPFIVDFFAPSAHLIVEVDGSIHRQSKQIDRLRDEAFAACGLRVLRLDAALVETDLRAAIALVRAALIA